MENQFVKFLQIGIVVENADETARHYEEEYGIGPWSFLELDSDRFEAFEVNGKTGEKFAVRCAFCKMYGFEIELVEPRSPGVFRDWLREKGPGIHHIAVRTRDPFEKVLEDHKVKTGKDPWLWCREQKAGIEFAYLELGKELGINLELFNEEKPWGLDP